MSWEVRQADCAEDGFGHWLAGLIDGEGCFRIQRGMAGRTCPYYTCQFSLKQRDDDRALLEGIVARTGIGRVRADRSRTGNSKPCAIWCVESKADTARLVALLDRFPLRSRKAKDYAVWREAVAHRAQEKKGNRWHGRRNWDRMEEFRVAILAAREYREGVVA